MSVPTSAASRAAPDPARWPAFVSFGEALTDLLQDGPDRWRSACGGAPWNMAVAMAALGVPSAFGGGLSEDPFGRAIGRASAAAGLDPRFLQAFEKSPLLALVHETAPPQYAFIGDDSADLHFDPAALPAGWSRALRWAHFGGLSLLREPLAARLLGLARRLKAEGRQISYDPNYRTPMAGRYADTLEPMCRLADLIKVSDEDLRGLFGGTDHRPGLARIRAWNPQAWLLLTEGEAGATLYRGGASGEVCEAWRVAAPRVMVVDSIGAGDAATAGLLCSLLQRPDVGPDQHLRWAVAAGTAACMEAGARPPSMGSMTALAASLSPARVA